MKNSPITPNKKKIIICCDGTGNQLGETYSNGVKIFSVIRRIQGQQVTYYDPGVGTLSYDKELIPCNGE